MSVELIENVTSRSFSDSATSASGTWKYTARVLGEANPETALETAVAADAPFFWYGLQRLKIDAEPLGGGLYSATVDYGTEVAGTAAPDPVSGGPGPGGGSASGVPAAVTSESDPVPPGWSFEIGGRPPKLFQSRSIVSQEGFDGMAVPDHARLINLDDHDKEPDGVEIDDPAGVLNIDVTLDSVSVAYLNVLIGAAWGTNANDWYFFPAGCAAFMGCTLSSTDNGRVKGSFRVGHRAQKTIAAGELRTEDDGVNPVKKLPTGPVDWRGWDYLEIGKVKMKDAASGLTVSRPGWYYLHEVLPPIDFAILGLGG